MSTDILDLEANYAWSEQRYTFAPTAEKAKDLAKKQILLDTARREKKWSLRWFTAEELDAMGDDAESWPTKPRKLLSMVTADEPPKITIKPQLVKWSIHTTLTLDSLIEMLQDLRKTRSGETPVMGVEFGGYSGLQNVLEEEDCIVIE